MKVKRMTPNLYTDDVEACVKFWVDRLHFEKTMEVPDGGLFGLCCDAEGHHRADVLQLR